jgi:hypothetical protein
VFGVESERFGVNLLVVLAEPAAGEPDGAGRSEHAEHEVLHLHRAEVLVVDGCDRFAGDHLGIVHQLFDVIDRRQCRADPFELLAHLTEGPGGDPFRHRLVEQVTVSAALTGRGKPGLVDDVGSTDQPHDPLGNGGGARGDRHPTTVFGEVRVAGSVVRRTVAVTAGDRTELVESGGAGTQNSKERLEQGQVDDLSLAVPLRGGAVEERGHDSERSGDPRHSVGETERRERRRPVFVAGLMSETAHGFGQRAEGASPGVRAGLAETGDTQHDQARVEGLQLLRARTPLLQHAGAEVLDQHVGIGYEVAQDLLAFGRTEVQRHASLVAGDDLPPQPVTVLVRAVRSRRIAHRVLHLDDVGAEVTEQHGCDRRGVHRADVEDADPAQGAVNGRALVWIVIHWYSSSFRVFRSRMCDKRSAADRSSEGNATRKDRPSTPDRR